eukprot:117583-Rhodomonas_salina.3
MRDARAPQRQAQHQHHPRHPQRGPVRRRDVVGGKVLPADPVLAEAREVECGAVEKHVEEAEQQPQEAQRALHELPLAPAQPRRHARQRRDHRDPEQREREHAQQHAQLPRPRHRRLVLARHPRPLRRVVVVVERVVGVVSRQPQARQEHVVADEPHRQQA